MTTSVYLVGMLRSACAMHTRSIWTLAGSVIACVLLNAYIASAQVTELIPNLVARPASQVSIAVEFLDAGRIGPPLEASGEPLQVTGRMAFANPLKAKDLEIHLSRRLVFPARFHSPPLGIRLCSMKWEKRSEKNARKTRCRLSWVRE